MAEHRVRVNLLSSALAIGVCVAVSMVVSVQVASRAVRQTMRDVREKEQTISVRGSARQRITSDVAVWRVRVRTEGAGLAQSYEQLEQSAAKVGEFLRKQGFATETITRSAVSTEPHFGRDDRGNTTRQVSSYELAQTIAVTSSDCPRVATAASQVTQLIKQGVEVVSCPPEFTYSKLPELRVSILGEAAKDARTRADEIARNSGCVIGEVRGAQTGILQVVQPNSTDVSGGGQYDTTTIDKDVTVVVNLTFAVREK